MKKRFLLLLILGSALFFTACQKEISLELGGTSSGSLQSDAGGECLPKTVQGIYEVNRVLKADSNYIDVQVNVMGTGTYRVYSDTVNGMFFQATGAFAATGFNTVRLSGGGTPLNAGTHNFTIHYDSTTCAVAISTLPQGAGNVNAEFTLAGAPDTCLSPVVAGDYIAGVALTPASTIAITVNVTVAGTYNLATNQSNGITFSGSGVLANTGQQTITLVAAGTPAVAGAANFQVTAGASICSFTINVTDVQQTADYFPRTAGSNWSYQFDDNPEDSMFVRAKAGTVNLGGNDYTPFESTFDAVNDGFADAGFYRKSGGDYHNYVDIGNFFGFDSAQNVDYIFLKDNVAANTSWQTTGFSGSITDSTGSFAFTIRLSFTIDQKDVAVTVGGVSYPNTIVVSEKYELLNGATWLDATPVIGYYKSYYARNIGLIKQEYYYEDGNPNPGVVIFKQDLRRHQVF